MLGAVIVNLAKGYAFFRIDVVRRHWRYRDGVLEFRS
jgi:hypothetical protein